MSNADKAAIEAGARAMYEDFRANYPGRHEATPDWSGLATDQQGEWLRHSRVAFQAFKVAA